MKWALLGIFVFSVLHIHFRGKVRLPFRRQIFDHSSFMAPLNLFMHTFSKVPATPYLSVDQFPELAPLQQNWQIIRDEALRIADRVGEVLQLLLQIWLEAFLPEMV